MARVNDVRNMAGQLENEWEKLRDADIPEADKEALIAYGNWKKRRVGSIGTLRTYLNRLRNSAKRSDKPLVEYESTTDVDALLDAHEDAGCSTANALNNHLSAVRGFWKWLDSTPEYGRGREEYRFRHFIENVEPNDENPGTDPLPDGYDSLAEFILSEEEIAALREGADNRRDEALVEFLCDTGPRIALALQLKRGQIDVDGSGRPTFRPNPEGKGHKKVPDKDYLLHESARAVRVYLREEHPDDHADAPVFANDRGYDSDDRENWAISPSTAKTALDKAAEAAGIDRRRVHHHNLRKTAVTRMRVKHNMSWETIQMRTGWSDKSLAEMKEVYRSIENSDQLEMVAEELGAGSSEDDDEPAPTCWDCGRELSPGATYCPGCGADQEEAPTMVPLEEADQYVSNLAAMNEALMGAVLDAGHIPTDEIDADIEEYRKQIRRAKSFGEGEYKLESVEDE